MFLKKFSDGKYTSNKKNFEEYLKKNNLFLRKSKTASDILRKLKKIINFRIKQKKYFNMKFVFLYLSDKISQQ